jgi:hypothetical protein
LDSHWTTAHRLEAPNLGAIRPRAVARLGDLTRAAELLDEPMAARREDDGAEAVALALGAS